MTSPSSSSSPPEIQLSPPDLSSLSLTSPQQKQKQPKTEFTPFPLPLLPLELRLKIYGYINCTPRIVSIQYKSVFTKPEPSEAVGGGRKRARKGSSFVNRWVSDTVPPVGLGVCREMREEALKVYDLAFGSLEGPAQIYFNFETDTLYFGNPNSNCSAPRHSHRTLPPSNTSPITPPYHFSTSHLLSLPSSSPLSKQQQEQKQTATSSFAMVPEPSPYRLDLFLGGDYYGVPTRDFSRVKNLALDISEELYGRRSFCWEDVRNLRGVEKVVFVVWEEEDDLEKGSAMRTGGSQRERNMNFYRSSLRRVWDKYVRGIGEGLGAGYGGDGAEEGPREWVIPEVVVWNAWSGRCWGGVKLELGV